MSSSDVFLHTAPADNAPLVFDPYLAGQVAGTRRVENWGSRASTGQQFVVCDRRPGWKAIWYGGQKAWFADSPAQPTSLPALAKLLTPKAGKRSAPVYGTAYPPANQLPSDPLVQAFAAKHAPVVLSRYTIPTGQRYVLVGPAVTDLYFAGSTDGSSPYDRTDLHGSDRYDWIFFNHRMALVRADDVDVIQPRA